MQNQPGVMTGRSPLSRWDDSSSLRTASRKRPVGEEIRGLLGGDKGEALSGEADIWNQLGVISKLESIFGREEKAEGSRRSRREREAVGNACVLDSVSFLGFWFC
eukprot:Selendium_serpulae@DN10183_c0_g1_i1.p4